MFFGLVVTLFVAAAANAQVTGNIGSPGMVNFSVTVPDSFDLRSGGNATASDASITGTSHITNNALSMTLNFGDVSPNVNNSMLSVAVPIRLRSNRTYGVYASRTGTSTASLGDFESSDIGMGITYNARSGALVDSGTDTPVTSWGSDPAAATVSNGVPTFSQKVDDLSATALKISNGSRISLGGDTTSTNNFVEANLRFAVKRQFFTATTSPYTDTVNVHIAAP